MSFLAAADPILNTSTALIITGEISSQTELWVMLTAVSQQYADSVISKICASGGPDEYCDPAGSL
jgi:hypothetical protein